MKIYSRKLFVFVLTTIGMLAQLITEETWLYIALMYIGSQATVDLVSSYKTRTIGGELPSTDSEG